jgi:hypothetical protein
MKDKGKEIRKRKWSHDTTNTSDQFVKKKQLPYSRYIDFMSNTVYLSEKKSIYVKNLGRSLSIGSINRQLNDTYSIRKRFKTLRRESIIRMSDLSCINRESIFYSILQTSESFSNECRSIVHPTDRLTMSLRNETTYPLRIIIVFNEINKFYPLFKDVYVLPLEEIKINSNYVIDNVIVIQGDEAIILNYDVGMKYNICEVEKSSVGYSDIARKSYNKHINSTTITLGRERATNANQYTRNGLYAIPCTQIEKTYKVKPFTRINQLGHMLFPRVKYCYYSFKHTRCESLKILSVIELIETLSEMKNTMINGYEI